MADRWLRLKRKTDDKRARCNMKEISMHNMKQFASSSNGDAWLLATDDETQEAFVLHKANPSSGGHETRTPVEVFLNTKPYGPEREALLAILGVDDDTADGAQTSYKPSSA